ncbi:MAG: hypothetical protein L0Z73_07315, partial [Gammaproteobacteria bacterium]|nr:hypothetical protein [Gammaproteobacteria bacterium]
MTRFLIKESDPLQYKTEIVDFWKNYLPGTPPERFDWMNSNPDGKPIWYLAFEKDSNKLAGTVSIMPRKMINNGKTLRAGIIGDFMIGDKYRVYGPALDLQKTVVASLKNHHLDFLYTLPNKASLKLNERTGLRNIADLDYYVKPIYVAYYLEKHVNHSIARVISPIVKVLLAIGSKETYMTNGGIYREVKDIDGSFDTLWNRIKEKRADLLSNRGAEYLRWRYLKDPLLDFQVITVQDKPDGEISGYIVFTIIDHKME